MNKYKVDNAIITAAGFGSRFLPLRVLPGPAASVPAPPGFAPSAVIPRRRIQAPAGLPPLLPG